MKWLVVLAFKILKRFNYYIVDIPMVIKGIGHQIVEPCIFIKRQQLGLIPPNYRLIVFFSLNMTYSTFSKPHVNHHLIKYLKSLGVVTIFEYSESLWEKIKFQLFARIIYQHLFNYRQFLRLKSMIYNVDYYMSSTTNSAAMFETNALHKEVLFQIQKSDLNYGKSILKQLGLPTDAWFIAFHYREGSFYKGVKYWEQNYNNRCVDVLSYQMALEEIASLGGYCFRIAARNSVKLPGVIRAISNVFDIDAFEGDIDRFSVFLLSQSRFFLCCNSGPSIVAGFFGVPAAQVQTAPFYGAPIHHFDLFIFKKYKHLLENRILNLKEMMVEPYNYIRLDESYQQHHIEVLDNTSEEVLMLVREMLMQTDTPRVSYVNDYILSKYTAPNVYCSRACSRISKHFFEHFQQQSERLGDSIALCYENSTSA